jgi:hypothetical protein
VLGVGFQVSAEFNHLGLKLGFFKWKAWIYDKIPRFSNLCGYTRYCGDWILDKNCDNSNKVEIINDLKNLRYHLSHFSGCR